MFSRVLQRLEPVLSLLLHLIILYLYFTDKISFVEAMTIELLGSIVTLLSRILKKMDE